MVKLPFNTVDEFNVDVPATYKLPNPAPPAILNAPVVVDDEVSVNVVMIFSDEVIVPTETISLVPIVRLPFSTADEFNADEPSTYKLPSPAPPEILNAPVVVDDEVSVLLIMIFSDEVIVPTETISLVPMVKLPFNTVAPPNVDVDTTFKVPFNAVEPETYKLPNPAPPAILNAPVVVDDEVSVNVVMIFSDEVIVPTETISLVPIVRLPFNTVAPPNVDVDTTFNVPSITPLFATYKLPIPAPPAILNAPVVVDDDVSVLLIMIFSDEVIVPTETISLIPIVKLPFNTIAPPNVDVDATFNVPSITLLFETYKLPNPAPPDTRNAPVVVDEEVSVNVVIKLPDEFIEPIEIISLVPIVRLPFNTVALPNVVFEVTFNVPSITLLFATYKLPIPAPPAIRNAPVVVDEEVSVNVVIKLPDEFIEPIEIISLVPIVRLPFNTVALPNVVFEVTFNVPSITLLFATYKLPIPAPPATCNAPVVVDDEVSVNVVIKLLDEVIVPTDTISLVPIVRLPFNTVALPNVVFEATFNVPSIFASLATYKLPIPAPPATCNAPVVVDDRSFC
jgi:hypothetical protein